MTRDVHMLVNKRQENLKKTPISKQSNCKTETSIEISSSLIHHCLWVYKGLLKSNVMSPATNWWAW